MYRPDLAFITNVASPYQRDLFTGLHQAGVKLHVLFMAKAESNRDWPPLDEAPYTFEYLSPHFLTRLGHLNPSIVRRIKAIDPTLWVVGGSYVSPTVLIARQSLKYAGRNWVFWGERPSRVNPRSWLRAYLRWFLADVDQCWGISSRAKAIYGRLTKPSVPALQVSYVSPPTSAASRRVGQRPSWLELLFVGQLIERKRPSLAVECQIGLARQGVDSRLTLIGDGPLRPQLEEVARERTANITLLGGVDRQEVLRRMSGADLLLAPSTDDGWGLMVMESLAQGTPVVGTEYVDALFDAVSIDPTVGSIAEPDPQSLGTAVLRLVQEGRCDDEKQRRACQRVAQCFGVEATVERILEAMTLMGADH